MGNNDNEAFPLVNHPDSVGSMHNRTPVLMSALRRLLRPVVRLALRHQISFPTLAELLKSLFVEVAERDFQLDNKPQSDSRLYVLTGIHRRDIKRLRNQAPEQVVVPANISIGGQAVSRWCTDKRYADDNGRPAALPRQRKDGSAISFDSLISSISKDIRPRTLLDEWLRIGVVELDNEGFVHLRTEAFIPEKGFEEKLYYLGRNLHDHIAACEHNIDDKDTPFFERSVHYPALHVDDVEVLREQATAMAMDTLTRLNALVLELRSASENKAGPRERFNFGAYFYKEPAAETGQDIRQETEE